MNCVVMRAALKSASYQAAVMPFYLTESVLRGMWKGCRHLQAKYPWNASTVVDDVVKRVVVNSFLLMGIGAQLQRCLLKKQSRWKILLCQRITGWIVRDARWARRCVWWGGI